MFCWNTITSADDLEPPPTYKCYRDQVFYEVDGVQLKADVYEPLVKGVGPSKDQRRVSRPLVVMIHGGFWTVGDKWDLADHGRELAQAGCVAVAINYRLAPQAKILQQIDDCRQAVKWAQENASSWQADPQQTALWGYSAGGHLALVLACEQRLERRTAIRCVVAGGAPCEFSFMRDDNRLLTHVFGGTKRQVPEIFNAVSPLKLVEEHACPTFFFHGTDDRLVPMSSSLAMYDRLRELGVVTEYFQVQRKGHLLAFLDADARRAAIEFLISKVEE